MRCRRRRDARARWNSSCAPHTAELEAARSNTEAKLAGAAARLQNMAQEWRERCQALEDRLQESEGATQAVVAAHEKTVGRMTAQNDRKVHSSRYICI